LIVEIDFAAEHPAVAGHFPGNPIMPGALLLDQVVQLLGDSATVIRSAKFFRPVRPGERVRVTWEAEAGGEVKFECRLADDGVLVAAGTLA
jgi:3-hydroxymyristoyl/3-hydroxydecanoyl-(acyl carrier protein) dehydratase